MSRPLKAIRRISPVASVLLGCILSFIALKFNWTTLVQSLSILQKGSFLMAGFIVTAFNLRFKLVDALCSDNFSSGEMERLSRVFKKCRNTLELCIFLFLLSAFLMSVAPLLLNSPIPNNYSHLTWGLFTASCVSYIWILKSFRELEDGLISKIKKKKQTKEATATLEKAKILYQPTPNKNP